MLIRPKDIVLEDQDKNPHPYVISKIPATHAREIVAQYPTSALPKIGDYSVNQDMMLKLMSYVGVPRDKMEPLQLTTRALVDNHVPDLKTLSRLEIEMFKYNFDFFLPEDLSNLGERLKRILSIFLTQIVTQSLRESSRAVAQPSTNSEPPIA